MIKILNVSSTTTSTLGAEDKAKAEFRIEATGSECELQCFKETVGDYAESMCIECKESNGFSVFEQPTPIFGGAFYNEDNFLTYIEKVVYNKSKKTTVVVWNDGVVTKSTCQANDVYNREMGLVLAVLKRFTDGEFVSQLLCDWSTEAEGDTVVRTLKDVRRTHRDLEKSAK